MEEIHSASADGWHPSSRGPSAAASKLLGWVEVLTFGKSAIDYQNPTRFIVRGFKKSKATSNASVALCAFTAVALSGICGQRSGPGGAHLKRTW